MEVTLTCRRTANEADGDQRLNVDLALSDLAFLPPAFELLPRLLLLLDDPEANCDDFADIIRVDPGLTANVLRISRSAVFGGARRADSIAEALMRLGIREVYRLVMEIITSPALKMADGYAFGRVDLWRHSLAAAIAAETLARRFTDQDPESIFTAALLHDIGKPLLARVAGADYFKLLKAAGESMRSVHELESERFSVNHTEMAGRLLRSWGFPEPIVTAVAGHHSLAVVHRSVPAALVYAGNVVAYRIGQGNGYPPYAVSPDREVLALFGCDLDELAQFEDEILERLRREQEKLR
jgi:putative nucleotidyltransferase with HDIG domain